jgi:hypothetical protein
MLLLLLKDRKCCKEFFLAVSILCSCAAGARTPQETNHVSAKTTARHFPFSSASAPSFPIPFPVPAPPSSFLQRKSLASLSYFLVPPTTHVHSFSFLLLLPSQPSLASFLFIGRATTRGEQPPHTANSGTNKRTPRKFKCYDTKVKAKNVF